MKVQGMLPKSIRPLTLLASALLPLSALAAGTATLQTGQDVSTMSWQDSRTVRFDTPKSEGYMLVQGDKVYVVQTQGGGPQVMEVGAMMQGFAQAAQGKAGQKAGADKLESVKATGRKETVAGIVGEVYELRLTNVKGQTRSTDAVLTGHPLVVEMTAAYMGLSAGLAGAKAVAQFKDGLPAGKTGLLRMGIDMKVQAISSDAPAATAFKLPAKPVTMQNMMQEMMKQMPRRP